jgi:hypothetical protein
MHACAVVSIQPRPDKVVRTEDITDTLTDRDDHEKRGVGDLVGDPPGDQGTSPLQGPRAFLP